MYVILFQFISKNISLISDHCLLNYSVNQSLLFSDCFSNIFFLVSYFSGAVVFPLPTYLQLLRSCCILHRPASVGAVM